MEMKSWEEAWHKRIISHKVEHEKAGYGSPQSQTAQFSMVKDLLGLDGSERIVDFGCGTGLFCQYLKAEFPNLWYIGYDIIAEALTEASDRRMKRARFICENIGHGNLFETLPICDAVTCIGLFQTLEGSIALAVTEAFLFLRKGGQFIAVTLNQRFKGDYETSNKMDGKEQVTFDPKILTWIFQDVGFEDIKIYSFSGQKAKLSEDLTKYHVLVIKGTKP